MNPNQQQAVDHHAGPLLIIAGAGTGKTSTLVEKIHTIIKTNLAQPNEILALTFTEKAANEMEERVDRLLPYGYTQTWIATFHSFADTILRQEISHIGITPGYRVMTEAETIAFLREHLYEFNLEYFKPLGNPNKFLEALLQHISRLRDEDISIEEYRAWSIKPTDEELEPEEIARRAELVGAYEQYQKIKIREGVFDYADLLYYLLHLYRTRPNILAAYHKQFKYILVDEFQDTNIAQYNLIKLLAPPDSNPKLTVVGDDSQAIYKFRGASVSNILTFMKDYPTAQHITLSTNYRSNQAILDHSYTLIKFNDPDTLEAQLGISKKLTATADNKTPKGAIEFNLAERIEEEAADVATQIMKISQDYEYRDMAILLRANSHSEAITHALNRQGIPYYFHGPGALYKQPEIKDLIALLNVLADPEDSVSMYRVLNMRLFGIDTQDMTYLLSFSKKTATPLLRTMEIVTSLSGLIPSKPENEIYRPHLPYLKESTKAQLAAVYTHIKNAVSHLKRHTAGQILFTFLDNTGYLKLLTNVASEREVRGAQHIAKFFDKLKAYESTHEDASVHAIVDYLKLSLEMGESPSTADTDEVSFNAVNILTVHGSKGLEFPVVFLVNLSSERFPTRARRETIPIPQELIKEVLPQGDYHIEEERRLFYVAMTRAKDRLFLSASRYYGEGKRARKVSPFVFEALGKDHVEQMLNIKTQEKQQLSIFDFKPVADPVPLIEPKKTDRTLFLSYTQLDTYERCPLRYKYQFVLKIPAAPNAAASFGTSVHSALQLFYQQFKLDQNIGVDQLLSYYHASWIPIGYSSQAHEARTKREGEKILTRYYDEYHSQNIKVLDLERLFKLKITDKVFLSGKIDRVDQHDDGHIEIIDYKTGRKPSEKDLKDNIQLAVYLMAAEEKNMYAKPAAEVTLTFYYLQDQAKISMQKTEEDIVKVRETVLDATQNILAEDYHAVVGPHCDFCPFKMICEAWQ